jgi:hypothetical protein
MPLPANDYESYGNDYMNWVIKAEDLLIASQILEQEYMAARKRMEQQKSGVVPNEYRCLESMIYLRVLSLELYLKALILKNGEKLVVGGKFVGNKKHSLQDEAKAAGVSLKPDEQELVSKLTTVMQFWGRYPIPLYSHNWRKKVPGITITQPIYVWSDHELHVCNQILEQVRRKLV